MFNKEKFAIMLKKALGERTINQYALHSGVSATYISKLLRQLVKKPPGVEVISKLASKASNGITYLDLMSAAGHINPENLDSSIEVESTDSNVIAEELTELFDPILYEIKDLSPESRQELEKYLRLLKIKDEMDKSKDETSSTSNGLK